MQKLTIGKSRDTMWSRRKQEREIYASVVTTAGSVCSLHWRKRRERLWINKEKSKTCRFHYIFSRCKVAFCIWLFSPSHPCGDLPECSTLSSWFWAECAQAWKNAVIPTLQSREIEASRLNMSWPCKILWWRETCGWQRTESKSPQWEPWPLDCGTKFAINDNSTWEKK